MEDLDVGNAAQYRLPVGILSRQAFMDWYEPILIAYQEHGSGGGGHLPLWQTTKLPDVPEEPEADEDESEATVSTEQAPPS